MSGGVDSAVAAARAVEAGHDVVGVHLALSPDARHPAHRQPRLLHHRGLDGRPARRQRARHPVLRVGLLRALQGRRRRRLHRRIRRRRTPTPACAATSGSSSPRCWKRRSPSGSTPSAPATTPSRSTTPTGNPELHRAADWAKDQSYVLGVLTARTAQALHVPARRTRRPRPRSAPRPNARGLSVAQQAGQPRHLLHPRRRHRRLAGREDRDDHRRHRRRTGAVGRRARGRPRVHGRPAPRPEARHAGRRRQAALRAGDPAEGKQGGGGAARRSWPSTRSAASRSPGPACRSRRSPPARNSTATPRSARTATPCLPRAHGSRCRMPAEPRGHADGAAARRGARPDCCALPGQPGAGPGHHRCRAFAAAGRL